jgi:hypothetical protein
MALWQVPKTDWLPTDGVKASDLNRIENDTESLLRGLYTFRGTGSRINGDSSYAGTLTVITTNIFVPENKYLYIIGLYAHIETDAGSHYYPPPPNKVSVVIPSGSTPAENDTVVFSQTGKTPVEDKISNDDIFYENSHMAHTVILGKTGVLPLSVYVNSDSGSSSTSFGRSIVKSTVLLRLLVA